MSTIENIFILTINPGSTSTKFAVFENGEPLFVKTIRHSAEELEQFDKITDQFEFRKELIMKELKETGVDLDKIRAVVGRGGLLRPIESGIYEVNGKMINDLYTSPFGEHASNLGGLIAENIAKSLPNARAFIADPVVVDELQDIARLSGHPKFPRVSIFHALNQKAIARQHAKNIQRNYEDLNLIVVHLGGGISVAAHQKGRVIDVNNALNGDGPFSPERSGGLPTAALVNACFSGEFSKKEINKMLVGEGGLVAYLGTNSAIETREKIESGDTFAELVYDAMGYQIAKDIGAMAAVLSFDVDYILFTGGIAYDSAFVNKISARVEKIAPVAVYPGEDELQALAMNGLMVLTGEIDPKGY